MSNRMTSALLQLAGSEAIKSEALDWAAKWLRERRELPQDLLDHLGNVSVGKSGLVSFQNQKLERQLEYGDQTFPEYQFLTKLRAHIAEIARKHAAALSG